MTWPNFFHDLGCVKSTFFVHVIIIFDKFGYKIGYFTIFKSPFLVPKNIDVNVSSARRLDVLNTRRPTGWSTPVKAMCGPSESDPVVEPGPEGNPWVQPGVKMMETIGRNSKKWEINPIIVATEALIIGTAPLSSLLWIIKHGDMNGDNGEGITQFFSGGMPWGRFCQDDPVWVILELSL